MQVTPYDVLLSYPNDAVPNSVRVLDGGGRVVYDGVEDESDLSNQPGVVRPFHGYSPAGLVEVRCLIERSSARSVRPSPTAIVISLAGDLSMITLLRKKSVKAPLNTLSSFWPDNLKIYPVICHRITYISKIQ